MELPNEALENKGVKSVVVVRLWGRRENDLKKLITIRGTCTFQYSTHHQLTGLYWDLNNVHSYHHTPPQHTYSLESVCKNWVGGWIKTRCFGWVVSRKSQQGITDRWRGFWYAKHLIIIFQVYDLSVHTHTYLEILVYYRGLYYWCMHSLPSLFYR